MADPDYAPVGIEEDDEEKRVRSPYPAVIPPSIDAVGPQDGYSDVPPTVVGQQTEPLSGISLPQAPAAPPPVSGSEAPAPLSPPRQRLQALTAQGAPQVHELHGIKKVLDVLGQTYMPRMEEAIRYGPQLKYQHDLAAALGDVKAEQEPEEEAAKVEEQKARTTEAKARAEAAKNPPAKPQTFNTPEEATIHDLMTGGENGQPRINPETNKPYSYLEAYGAVTQAKQDTKPAKETKTDKVVRVVNGVPHTFLINAESGEDIKDEGQTKVPGESPADKRSAAEMTQVERESRQNIRKAEGKYRDTQKSVAQLTAGLDAAKDSNGLLTSFVPTMEVLGINAANGVHRISPAEARAAQLPGGWAERFNAWFDKAVGGKLSPQLVSEGKTLAKMLSKTAYQEYNSTYDDEQGIASGYGIKDFDKRMPKITEEQEQGGGPSGGTTRYQVGNDLYDIPADKKDAFLKKYRDAKEVKQP